jgi:serine/threonine-protein kinase
MGEVYRARDTRLGREVALKTLPAAFTEDPERVARFRREAQLLAALNHPRIASIYGLEEADGHRFLVLELIEGETLADRIARGPLPVDEALAIAREIAEALEAAHGKGIVHRDLKPANVALTSDDKVKVLDFGLAKAYDASGVSSGDPANSPTMTSPVVLTGLEALLGTAAYMSPEQARGRAADKRSDVWAFGCVLYEMLTGRRAFDGDNVGDTLADVLRGAPAWAALPPALPTTIRALLEGCLEKAPQDRISDISTALFVLKHPQPVSAPSAPGRQPGRRWWAPAAVVLALGAIAAGAAAFVWNRKAEPRPVTRLVFHAPEGRELSMARGAVAVSPDGRQLVYAAGGRLFLRSLSDFESRPIAGADGGIHPVFSPDGGSIVFWADDELKRIASAGGVPVTVCETAPAPFGINWGDDAFSSAAVPWNNIW